METRGTIAGRGTAVLRWLAAIAAGLPAPDDRLFTDGHLISERDRCDLQLALASSQLPAVRSYLSVCGAYYLWVAASEPFFESGLRLAILGLMPLGTTLFGAIGFVHLKRTAPSLLRLEVWAATMNVLVLFNMAIYLAIHFEPYQFFYFVLMAVVFASSSPTLRVAYPSLALAFGGLILLFLHSSTAFMGQFAFVAIAGAFVSVGLASGLNAAVVQAMCAKLALQAANRKLHTELQTNERLREDAQAADRAKTDFLANMSHELRTPLNGVIGTASVLARTTLTAAQSEMVNVMQTSAVTLQTLLSDVLDLAKIEAGRIDLQVQTTSAAAIARHVATLFAAPSAAKGLTFSSDIDAGASDCVLADSVRLTQILTNLCSNAVKFTSRGGVRLEVRTQDRRDHQHVVFKVADTGIGMSEAGQARIFDRFSQADGSITRRFGGTGLGLSISRQLVELMGGSIAVCSTEGVGSTFEVELELPRAAAPAPAALAPIAPAVASRLGDLSAPHRLRILVVEDHPVNQRILQMMLADRADVEVAADGIEGIAAFTRVQQSSNDAPFDAILMDMQMPLMDGPTATRAIRAQEASCNRRRTPIIMLTANAMPEHVRLSQDAGADLHLTKPVTIEALFGALDTIVDLDAKIEQSIDAVGGGVLDRAAFDALTSGDLDFKREVVATFIASGDQCLADIVGALRDRDLDTLGRRAHSLRGASASIHAHRLSETALQLEDAARSGEIPEIDALIPQLAAGLRAVTVELARASVA